MKGSVENTCNIIRATSANKNIVLVNTIINFRILAKEVENNKGEENRQQYKGITTKNKVSHQLQTSNNK